MAKDRSTRSETKCQVNRSGDRPSSFADAQQAPQIAGGDSLLHQLDQRIAAIVVHHGADALRAPRRLDHLLSVGDRGRQRFLAQYVRARRKA
jgi:hypothetical protein